MATDTSSHRRRLSAAMRQGEQVTPLELFFDLVFVLAMLAHVAFRYRHIHSINRQRTLLALALLAFLPIVCETGPARRRGRRRCP